MRDTDVFGLRSIDLIAENPAARGAMGIHAAPAVFALAVCGYARNQHAVASLEGGHGRPAESMAPTPSWPRIRPGDAQVATSPLRICRSVPQIVVFVILTIASPGALGLGSILEGLLARALVDKRFHGILLTLARDHCPRASSEHFQPGTVADAIIFYAGTGSVA
jgi:hypothetical protein